MNTQSTTFISDLLEPVPSRTLAVVLRWLSTPFAAILGALCAMLALTVMRYINMWYIGASEDSGFVWIATHTGEPLLTSFAFIRAASLAAPRFHAEVALVFTTIVAIYLVIWAAGLAFTHNFGFGQIVTICFMAGGAAWGLISAREELPSKVA